MFPGLPSQSPHSCTRQYSRVVKRWATLVRLNPEDDGTHSLRRTKAPLTHRRTKNLRAVRRLPDHTKPESTVRHPGIEVNDVL